MTTRLIKESRDGNLELVVSREFDAPRRILFEAWTKPEHFAQWFGPDESTVPFCEIDARPGGKLRFCHRFESMPDVWIKGLFRDVVEPELLTLSVVFSDEAGNTIERPGFPREMWLSVTFIERRGKTEVTVHQTGLALDQGESEGWLQSFERLAGYLDSVAV